jgi:hypothetical protein
MLALSSGDSVLVVAYSVLAVAALAARHHERSDPGDVWPMIWVLVAAFLVAGGIGRAFDVVGQVGDAARTAAREDGWYEARRWFQRLVVLLTGGVWASSVLFAALRTPERRRRYVPIAVAIVSLAAFVVIRAVSLHSIDSITNHELGPIDVGIVIELILLVAVGFGVATAWRPHAEVRPPSTSAGAGGSVSPLRSE